MRRSGCKAFGLWAVPGVVVGFQVSAVGVLLLPIGILAAFVLARSTRVWPEILGIFAGIAAVCLLIAGLNADYRTCPPSGQVVTRTASSVSASSCGGFNPWPWLIAGLLLAVGSAVAYGLLNRRSGGTRLGRTTPAVR